MANLKNITELPVAESAEGLNLIVNDNGAAKQIAAGAVGAQADWTETDETSPAFVKNKPVEEWDLDFIVNVQYSEDNGRELTYTVNFINTYANIKYKVDNSVLPKCKAKVITTLPDNSKVIEVIQGFLAYFSSNFDGGENPEHIRFLFWGEAADIHVVLTADDVIQDVNFA